MTDTEGNFEPGWNATIFFGTLGHNVSGSKSFIRLIPFLVLGDTMKAFRATGSFNIRRRGWQDFSIEIAAEDEKDAAHRILSNIGSHHRINRGNISIKEIIPISPGDVSDPIVKHLIGGT